MFTIKFDNPSYYVLDVESQPVGLLHLDGARAALGHQITIEKMYKTNSVRGSVTVEITELQARECGNLFRNTSKITVIVPEDFFTPRISWEYAWSQNQDGMVGTTPVISDQEKSRILEEWIAAGRPTRWGFQKKTQEEEKEEETA